MAEITKELGRIPVSRGDYQTTTTYYKDNIVQYKRGSYQVVSHSIIGVPPTNDKNVVNPGWILFAGTLDAQDVVNQIKDQEVKSIQVVADRESEILSKTDASLISANTKGLTSTNVQDNLKELVDKNEEQAQKLSELEKEVFDISEGIVELPVNLLEGYLNIGGSVGGVGDFYHAEFDVNEGQEYIVTGWNINSNIPAVLSYDDIRYERLLYQSTAKKYTDETIVIPEGVTKIVINGNASNNPSIVCKTKTIVKKSIKNKIAELEEEDTKTNKRIDDVESKLVTKELVFEKQDATIVLDKIIKFVNPVAEYDSGGNEYGYVDGVDGGKYRLSGYNVNSNYPLAFAVDTSTNSKIELYRNSTAQFLSSIEVDVPKGYNRIYVNGRTEQSPVIIEKQVEKTHTINEEIERLDKEISSLDIENSAKVYVKHTKRSGTVAGDAYDASSIFINQRHNNGYDVGMHFANKTSTPNKFFDFYTGYAVSRGEKKINPSIKASEDSEFVEIVGGTTDFIMPIVVAAENNKDGDFPDNTSYFTGGFHAYSNATSGNVTPTMREVSKVVMVDGKKLDYDTEAYGNKASIDVVNYIQACNTEKADGSGREVIRQNIHVETLDDEVLVRVEFIALETVKMYKMDAIGMYLSQPQFRFIGSKSKKGVYAQGANVNPNADDNSINAIRQFGDTFAFECGINKAYAEGDMKYNQDSFSANATNAKKAYFHFIGSSPVSLEEGDMLSFEGYFKFVE